MSYYNQSQFEIRCEWGQKGVEKLAKISDVIIIVDILSFSTCVEIANSRNAIIFPCDRSQEFASEFAHSVNAELAKKRGDRGYSLSPTSLMKISKHTRLVLPSPNGSSLSLGTGKTPTLAGCLRNCRTVALAAMKYGNRVAVIPAGEKWEDGSLRPGFEDSIGAGAIINHLQGSLSPDARAALAAFRDAQPHLQEVIKQCGSGIELIEKGFEQDVDLAAELDVSDCVPTLISTLGHKAYINKPD
ncbi:2-phosphosulfolactate phosphatase [Calothrix sp. 336/3]|uniref:2-phosphosulfolactate phosphatase n=1 Tax=Calothrix sp. 336/3 TaxID=1337936 RepID=UPI0004E43C7E|nr:2-phosphosulfolactate phosphatase [Calothrix sp. 336/3]AKG21428.1 lipoprotein [Calothrix sp. 336/3]